MQVVTLEKNFDVETRADATVDELREHVRTIASIPASHRIRLIHAGRMLTEGGKLLADCHIINSSFVHCSSIEIVEYGDVEKPNPGGGEVAAASSAGTYVEMPATGVPVYPGGPPSNQPLPPDVEQPDPDAWMAEVDMDEQHRQERLFQRLREARAPRAAAAAGPGREPRAPPPGGAFDNLLNDPAEGTNADFMCGLSLGFFLGIIMIFMLWELRMSRQQRMGVIMGIMMNGLFAVFRQNVRQMHAAEIIPQQ